MCTLCSVVCAGVAFVGEQDCFVVTFPELLPSLGRCKRTVFSINAAALSQFGDYNSPTEEPTPQNDIRTVAQASEWQSRWHCCCLAVAWCTLGASLHFLCHSDYSTNGSNSCTRRALAVGVQPDHVAGTPNECADCGYCIGEHQ
jgi:hypothetical protein